MKKHALICCLSLSALNIAMAKSEKIPSNLSEAKYQALYSQDNYDLAKFQAGEGNPDSLYSKDSELVLSELREKRDSAYFELRSYPDLPKLKELMKTPACERFQEITHNGKDDKDIAIKMDQLQVYKSGFLVDEYYRPNVYTRESYHVMMSSSKAVSATILDAAIVRKLEFAPGKVISYDTKLSEIYPFPKDLHHKWSVKNKIPLRKDDEKLYNEITIDNLVSMTSGIAWDESYDHPLGDFMDSLYGDGIRDIVSSSLSAPMEVQPGERFNYSGGNANIIQGIIRIIGERNFQTNDPNEAASKILFERLGIKGFFELDGKGSAIGSTYLYLRPVEMAKLGHLYLNGGFWDGKRLLSDRLIEGMREVNIGINGRELSQEYLEYIEAEGAPSNSITWLNRPLIDNKGVVRYDMEFPNSPPDMFFLAGHNGQVIFMLPSQDMVIVMTGQNRGYWDKVNRLVSTAVACFGKNKDSKIGLAPHAQDNRNYATITPAKGEASKGGLSGVIGPAVQLMKTAIPTATIAKELCSCLSVQLKSQDFKKDYKKARDNCAPDVPKAFVKYVDIDLWKEDGVQYVSARRLIGQFKRTAKVSKYGCQLVR